MALTIEQALKQGIAAHKEGKLQDAERLYRAILKSQPAHPHANHNLGLIGVSVSRADAALPLLKTALEASPKIEQFWLSYIDALIKANRFETAKQVLEQAKKQRVGTDRLRPLESRLSPKTQKPMTASVSPPQELITSLSGHYQNGRFSDAEKLSLKITQEFPKHQFAWKVLGAVLEATGRKSEAVDAKQTAVALSPQDADAHYNLSNTLKELGRLDEAEASYKQAIALKPDSAEVHNNLGITLQELCRLDESAASLKQAIALKPDFAEAHSNLGNTLKELGRLDEAEASYNQALALKPEFAEAHYNLGNTLKELGRLDEAEASYNQAIALKPDSAEVHNNLGITLQELCRLDESEASLKRAIALKPDFAEAHSNLGNTLQELGRLDQAETSYMQAIELKPDYAEAHLNLCELLEKMNRTDEILSIIRSASGKLFENTSDFLYFEALIEFRNENYKTAQELVEQININELLEKRKSAAMKLQGDLCHYTKDYSAAFKAYQIKNKHVKGSLEYKRQEPEKYFIQQREIVAQIEQLQEQSPYESEIKPSWIQPTFLIGFPRSGTTLLDTILRTHSNIAVLEELPMVDKMDSSFGEIPTISQIEAMDNASAEIVSNFYLEELKRHIEVGQKQTLVDKLPLNVLRLPLINQVFPNARYIIALRHPLDCVLSCWMQNFALTPAMANMVELKRIVDFYDTAMSILKLSEKRYSLETHRIRYEDLVLDFEKNVTELLTFLGLKWENELKNYQKTALVREKINTPSYSQVIKPIYQTASYRWKHYEDYLGQYKKRLAPWIQEYGYST